MVSKYDDYIDELHQRDYSVYDDASVAEKSLQELHDQDYRILDKWGTEELHKAYLDEFERVGRNFSFASWGDRAKHESPLIEDKELIKKSIPSDFKKKLGSVIGTLLRYKELKEQEKEKEKKALKFLRRLFRAEARLKNGPEPEIVEENVVHYFYMRSSQTDSRKYYKAMGLYDSESKVFTLKKGSVISEEMDINYRYSAEGFQRRKIVLLNCELVSLGYKMKKDIEFANPSLAASFVMGKKVDGMEAWIDESGSTLGVVYSAV